MNGKPFFDTNIVLYAFRKDDPRAAVAENLLAGGGTISVQILNEFAAVARLKLRLGWNDIGRALAILRVFCPEPIPLTLHMHERALEIARRSGYSIFDSLVIAAALEAGSTTLYTEDMQSGQEINGLTILNPFLGTA